MEEERYVTVAHAARATGLSRGQITYAIDKGLVRYEEYPITGIRRPWLADVLKLKPREKGFPPPSLGHH